MMVRLFPLLEAVALSIYSPHATHQAQGFICTVVAAVTITSHGPAVVQVAGVFTTTNFPLFCCHRLA